MVVSIILKARMLAHSAERLGLSGFMVRFLNLICSSSTDSPLATSEYIKQAEFALDIKRRTLPLYEQMFDVEYPLPKLDTLIVTPSYLSVKRRTLIAVFITGK